MKQRTMVLRTLALALAVVISMLGLSSCIKKADDTGSGNPRKKEESIQLKVAFMSYVADPPDLELVQKALNETLQDKLGVAVELIPINGGDYQQKLNLMLQNGDPLDLLVTGTGLGYQVQASTGQLKELDALLESDGQGITNSLGNYLKATMTADGQTYAVPVLQSYSSATTFVMRRDILEKYNINMAEIQTLDDLAGVLQTVKDNEQMIPVVPENPGVGVFGLGLDVLYDPLSDTIGVLPNYGQDTTVVNLFETSEYETWVYRLRDWFQNGYIMQDAATNNETAAALIGSGQGFGHFTGVSVGAADSATAAYGVEMEAVTFGEAFISSGNIATISWAIARQCDNPEAAMQFLNLLYTDPEIVNLIDYGIEGVHYEIVEDNVITYPEGIDASNHPYNFNLAWEFGNVFLSYVPLGTDPAIWENSKNANDAALTSAALGFVVDMEPVKTEMAAVTSVVNQYFGILGTGSVDPDVYLPEFISKLKDAGINKIIEEKQSQLDAWLAVQ